MKFTKWLMALMLVAFAGTAMASDPLTTLKASDPTVNQPAPPMTKYLDDVAKEVRNYPEQPPLVPHKIEGYQVDMNANKCLSCHARVRTGESKAPMVSITHYMDRDGQFLATVSPRRYFCDACHVPQADAKPLVENNFVDIDQLLNKPAK